MVVEIKMTLEGRMFGATFGINTVSLLIASALGLGSVEINHWNVSTTEGPQVVGISGKDFLPNAILCVGGSNEGNLICQEETVTEPEKSGRQDGTDLAIIPADRVDVQVQANSAAWVEASDERLKQLPGISGWLQWHGVIRSSREETQNRVPRNFELVIGAGGAEFLKSAYRIGFVEITRFDPNNNETPKRFILPPGITDPANGWVFPRNERKLGDSEKPEGWVFVGVQYECPAELPFKVSSVQGSVRFKLATEYENITIAKIAETEGRIDLKSLDERNIAISVRRIDDRSIVAEIQGNVDELADVNLMTPVADTAKSRVAIRDKVFYQIDFLSKIPADLSLQVQLVNRSREITLPFDLSDLVLRSEN